ncbi:MAG: hypothetical protein NZ958_03925 [Bacteroidia bacterium]|nr:hypothetical protein [Bacteroidia bacterium]MDW8088366.1 hypothetical protein [Bacteroidia bacterium]
MLSRWRKRSIFVGLLLIVALAEACASGRTGRLVWMRSGSCPATRVGNHLY